MPTRIWTKDEDFAFAGVSRDKYEPWEDGTRGKSIGGLTEWWWCQLYTDDGDSMVLYFSDKMSPINRRAAYPCPFVSIMHRSADGEVKLATTMRGPEDWYAATDTMDVRVGDSYFRGDTKTYEVAMSGLDGDDVSCKFTIDNPTPSTRPGTGDVRIGNEEDIYYNFTLPVHMGKFSGELTIDGQTKQVTGFCHIEHQWMNFHSDKDIAEWTMAHSPWWPYSFHIYDLTFSEQYGYARIPLMSVMHEERGLLYESVAEGEGVEIDVLEISRHEQLGYDIPNKFVYKFANDNVSGEIEFNVKEILDVISVNDLPGGDPLTKSLLEERGEHHHYIRLFTSSSIKIQEKGQPAYQSEPKEHALELQTLNGKFFIIERSGTTPVRVDATLKDSSKGGLA